MMPLPSLEAPTQPDVLLLFDASPASLIALEAALALAGNGSGLRAVYIEDRDWLCSAGYAFSAEVSAFSGALRKHDPDTLEQRLMRRREHVRRSLRSFLVASDRHCPFEVVRGRGVEQVLALLSPRERLVVGRVGYTANLGRGLGSLAMALARRAPGPVVLVSARQPDRPGSVAVLLDEPQTVSGLLDEAADRARRLQCRLLVLLSPGGADEQALSAWLAASQLRFELCRLPEGLEKHGNALRRSLVAASAGELLLSRRGRLFQSNSAPTLLARLPATLSVLP
ncbi:MAG: universal stress protein [Wenzhouxiangella sp.]|nr:universal stress protein [Wenzhouxiangella sp.]